MLYFIAKDKAPNALCAEENRTGKAQRLPELQYQKVLPFKTYFVIKNFDVFEILNYFP